MERDEEEKIQTVTEESSEPTDFQDAKAIETDQNKLMVGYYKLINRNFTNLRTNCRKIRNTKDLALCALNLLTQID